MEISTQIAWLFILAIPISCVSWIVTHEEIFSEIREYCKKCSQPKRLLIQRKFFYIFTCEYCFSFYVTALFLIITHYHLLFSDWRGYLIAGFSLIWVANIYMSLFFFIRIDIKKKGTETKIEEAKHLNSPS
jgi:hypothetical protein